MSNGQVIGSAAGFGCDVFADTAQLDLATGAVLFRYQAEVGGEFTLGPEGLRVTHDGDCSRRCQQTHNWNLGDTATCFVTATLFIR